jgi:adenine phosphoribosyltransferase
MACDPPNQPAFTRTPQTNNFSKSVPRQLAVGWPKKTAPPFRLKRPRAGTLGFALPIDYAAEPVIGPDPMAIAQDKFLAERVRNATRNAVGFPNPINTQFRDISPVVEGDPVLFRAVVEAMAGLCKETVPDCIMCVESWGYIFGAPVAYLLGCRMCLARRSGKLPREAFVEAYEMSYGPSKALAIQSEAVNEGDRVVIVDDIIASGGSALAAVKLIERAVDNALALCVLPLFRIGASSCYLTAGFWFTRSRVGKSRPLLGCSAP